MNKIYKRYFDMPNTEIPMGVLYDLPTNITPTEFKDKSTILHDKKVQDEMGYIKTKEGYLVSMHCPMPDVTPEMFEWWFWWHPQESDRYKLWFPGSHLKIRYDSKDKDYFESHEFKGFKPNTQYPTEEIGGRKAEIKIEFQDPQAWGFDKTDAAIVCGDVSTYGIKHTRMAHMLIDGALVSRFWMGEPIKSKILRNMLITHRLAYAMAEHCYVEYRNLARSLPSLYDDFG